MDSDFIDYYEVLQVNAAAHSDTIERVFRHLAQRYHPDNKLTGDSERFQRVVEANNVLRDARKRAEYDVLRSEKQGEHQGLVGEVLGGDRFESDQKVQEKLLELLYVKCRKTMKEPGMGLYELAQLLQCEMPSMEFHTWYLKEKGCIRRTEDGMLAITAGGIDRVLSRGDARKQHRITDQSASTIHL